MSDTQNDAKTFESYLKERKFTKCNSADDFKKLREHVRNYGLENIRKDLEKLGWVKDRQLTETNTNGAVNPFVKMLKSRTLPPYGNLLNIHGFNICDFFVAKNKEEYDENWECKDPKYIKRASMAAFHQFMLIRKFHWTYFNCATLGMLDNDNKDVIAMLREMKEMGLGYMEECEVEPIALVVHPYPFNSVFHWHTHLIGSKTGPNFEEFKFKNLSLDDVIQVLCDEDELNEVKQKTIKRYPRSRKLDVKEIDISNIMFGKRKRIMQKIEKTYHVDEKHRKIDV